MYIKSTVTQILFLLVLLIFAGACSKPKNVVNKTLLPASPSETFTDPQGEETSIALIAAVQKTGAKSINGKLVPKICEIARPHLDYMIGENNISHEGYKMRNALLERAGGTTSGEIVASNCSGSITLEKAAETCANSWVKSPGHWILMKKYWDGFCYDMKRADNCYYCIGLFSNGKW